jgi:hypothetical protein
LTTKLGFFQVTQLGSLPFGPVLTTVAFVGHYGQVFKFRLKFASVPPSIVVVMSVIG